MTFFIKKTSSKAQIINGSFDSIPWDQADKVYTEAANQAQQSLLVTLNRAHKQAFEDSEIAYAEAQERFNPESGSFEGSSGREFQPLEASDIEPSKLKAAREKAGYKAVEELFVKPYIQKSWSVKLLTQVVHRLSQHRLNTLGSNNTICGLQYLRDNFDVNSATDRGLYRFLMLDSRGSYLDKMGSGDAKEFCTLVPLVLYAHKLYNSVPYSKWQRETLHMVVNSSLHEAMLTEIPDFDPERLLELRETALQQKKDEKMVTRSAVTTYMLYRLNDTELAEYNTVTRHMLLQTWAAHPNNRTKYMVLDPMNWDTIPAPLLDHGVFKTPTPTKIAHNKWDMGYASPSEKFDQDLPWNN